MTETLTDISMYAFFLLQDYECDSEDGYNEYHYDYDGDYDDMSLGGMSLIEEFVDALSEVLVPFQCDGCSGDISQERSSTQELSCLI